MHLRPLACASDGSDYGLWDADGFGESLHNMVDTMSDVKVDMYECLWQSCMT